jgi:hypothetical protein
MTHNVPEPASWSATGTVPEEYEARVRMATEQWPAEARAIACQTLLSYYDENFVAGARARDIAFQEEATQQRVKEEAAAAEREAKERAAEDEWLAYQARKKTLLEQVFNYASTGNMDGLKGLNLFQTLAGARSARWTEVDTCTVTDGERTVDVRQLNETAFRVTLDTCGLGDDVVCLVSTDHENLRIEAPKGAQIDRLMNAWEKAFELCPGQESAF